MENDCLVDIIQNQDKIINYFVFDNHFLFTRLKSQIIILSLINMTKLQKYRIKKYY